MTPKIFDAEAHARAIQAAYVEGFDPFIVAFAAFMKGCVEHVPDPYVVIAVFVHGMLDGAHGNEADLSTSQFRKPGGTA